MAIPFVVPEILGGVEPPPQMPLSCQKRQMPLTVKKKYLVLVPEFYVVLKRIFMKYENLAM